MNIEEAKANIGKEVVYIGNSTLTIYDFNSDEFLITDVCNGYVHTRSNKVSWVLEPQELQIKHPTYKVGDQVVLDESTKPYTLTDGKGKTSERAGNFGGENVHTIIGIGDDGDVHLADYGWIQPRHLKLAPQEEVGLPVFSQPRLKDVTNLLQALDVSFYVEENDFAFAVKFADTSFQVMKNDCEALRYAEALVIAESLNKTAEFDVLMADKIKAVVLLQSHGFNAKLSMRGIEVV